VNSAGEGFFQSNLDDHPSDAGIRLLFAEFLEEFDDPRAAGIRWLAQRDTMPQDYTSTRTWDWNDDHHFDNLVGAIPHDLFVHLPNGRLSASESYREYPTRRDAEEAFCAAVVDATRPRDGGEQAV